MQIQGNLLMFLGRLLLAIVFLWGALGKFTMPEAMMGYMTSKGLTHVALGMYVAAFAELIGGVCLIIGYRTRLAAIGLLVFTIIVSFTMHQFWLEQGQEQMADMTNFMKNIAIMGGLLVLAASGPGKWSVDKA